MAKKDDRNELGDEKANNAADSVEGIKDSDFILLDDLVAAPLHALAKSDQQLRAHVVNAIKSMGTIKQNGQEQSIQLNNINIAYEQLKREGEDGYCVENLQMQVPILSIVPITNLNVEKAEIDFSTEVKTQVDNNGNCKIMARICSPEQRESDFLPRVTYKMKIKSLPATEGIMRITDILSSNQIAKKIDSTPIASDGNIGSEEQKTTNQNIRSLKNRVIELRKMYQKIDNVIDEQERLLQISMEAFPEDTFEFDKDKYKMIQSHVTNLIMQYEQQIMDEEIRFKLDQVNEM